MRKMLIRSASILGILLVLFTALVTLLRFYPYTYNFPAYPKITHTQSGTNGDPINVLFVGSKDQIMQSFQRARWLIPDPITPQTSAKIAADSLAHRSYPTAPVSNLYVFGRVQDLAFEKPTNDVQNRGHIRIWKTGALINGQPVWVGAASYDSGIELSSTNHFPTITLPLPLTWKEIRSINASVLSKQALTIEPGTYAAPCVRHYDCRQARHGSPSALLLSSETTIPLKG
jgi:LssY-like putative type I secretion system component LssY